MEEILFDITDSYNDGSECDFERRGPSHEPLPIDLKTTHSRSADEGQQKVTEFSHHIFSPNSYSSFNQSKTFRSEGHDLKNFDSMEGLGESSQATDGVPHFFEEHEDIYEIYQKFGDFIQEERDPRDEELKSAAKHEISEESMQNEPTWESQKKRSTNSFLKNMYGNLGKRITTVVTNISKKGKVDLMLGGNHYKELERKLTRRNSLVGEELGIDYYRGMSSSNILEDFEKNMLPNLNLYLKKAPSSKITNKQDIRNIMKLPVSEIFDPVHKHQIKVLKWLILSCLEEKAVERWMENSSQISFHKKNEFKEQSCEKASRFKSELEVLQK